MWARIRSVVDPKTDAKRLTAAQVDNWQGMDVLTVLDVLIEPNTAALFDGGNSLVAALEKHRVGALRILRLAVLRIVRAPAVNDIPAIYAGV